MLQPAASAAPRADRRRQRRAAAAAGGRRGALGRRRLRSRRVSCSKLAVTGGLPVERAGSDRVAAVCCDQTHAAVGARLGRVATLCAVRRGAVLCWQASCAAW